MALNLVSFHFSFNCFLLFSHFLLPVTLGEKNATSDLNVYFFAGVPSYLHFQQIFLRYNGHRFSRGGRG